MDDRALLDEFVRSRSQSAFRDLVERHLPVVYSTARRMVRDSCLAEEVAQSVFTTLAQKAESIRPPQVLGGWLYNTTRFLAMHAVRTEQRRREREQTAVAMQSLDPVPEDPGLAEHLEPAMAELDPEDRDALVLRFLSNRGLREVGTELGISEEAARKRVSRALDRLRSVLERRSISLTTVLLGAALTASTLAIPAGLGATITTAALGSLGGAAVTNATALTLKWLQIKIVAGAMAGVLAAGTGAYLVKHFILAHAPLAATAAAGAHPQAGPDRSPANSFGGLVRTPDGQPLPGAAVYLSTAAFPVPVYGTPSPAVPSTRTGPDGRFSFPDDPANRAVIVLSEAGYGQATVAEVAARPEVTLQRWARVEGTLRRGSAALANETIHLSRTRFGSKAQEQTYRTVHDATTKAGAAGHYVFPRVAPGDAWISWRVKEDHYDVQYRYLDIQPGAFLTADIGGRGRPITGRAVLVGGDAPVQFFGSVWPKTLHQMRRPPDWPELSREEQARLVAAWEKSPDARLYNQERCPIDFRLDADGAFTVPDVLPGSYRIVVASWSGAPVKSKMISRGVAEVIIPETPGGRSGEALDVGEIKAYQAMPLQPGELAPPFETRTLDGQSLKLADFEGRFVLLNFWRTDFPETQEHLPYLKSAQAAWGKDKRFVLIGLNFDPDLPAVRNFVDTNGITWTQCFLGKQYDIPARYRLRRPTTLLIGPYGQILSLDLAGPAIAPALQDALGAK